MPEMIKLRIISLPIIVKEIRESVKISYKSPKGLNLIS